MICHLLIYLLAIGPYSAEFPDWVREATDYFSNNKSTFISNTPGLNETERCMAAAVVAPEVSSLSSVLDFLQLRSLYVTYVYQGSGNFSIGIFQMKPRFAEMIEKKILADKELKKEYSRWIKEWPKADGSTKERRERLKRLESEEWQMRYLTLFMQLAKKKISARSFPDEISRLKYIATLYNSGLDSTPDKVEKMMQRKLFPHIRKKFNYASVSAEFYPLLKSIFISGR